jgi:hypothetical protein
MRIPLCRCQPRSQPQPLFHNSAQLAQSEREKGQILVIFAGALVILLFFIGLALDAGSLYVTYGNLKRAVDSAAVAAANEFKRDADTAAMTLAANEVLGLMNVDYSSLELLLCDGDNDGVRDTGLPILFEARCPNTPTEDARKLVWVKAEQRAPLYFLSLMGFNDLVISTNTISEAAPLDVVIVLDTSESMAWGIDPTTGLPQTPGYIPNQEFNTTNCNLNDTCQPMKDAKDAAKALIGSLAQGYDRVAIVTYDTVSYERFALGTDLDAAEQAIDDLVKVHDDPPIGYKIWPEWRKANVPYNPMNSEDLDGDGLDYDDPAKLGYTCPFAANYVDDPEYLADRWWTVDEGLPPGPYIKAGWNNGVPCDRDDMYDSLNWYDPVDGSGNKIPSEMWKWTIEDHDQSVANLGSIDLKYRFTNLSTCSGCGLREGTNQLKNGGRFGAVWVMVFLSDGAVNLSDAPPPNYAGNTYTGLPNGFCDGRAGTEHWNNYCKDNSFTPRYCFDSDSSTCPPGTTHVVKSAAHPILNTYSVLDYALDMVDEAALTISTNTDEPLGNEIAIYSIGLNVDGGVAEQFLRYMAAVGDDGDRDTDQCGTTAPNESCGQYYYAPTGDRLLPIFEDIASRIYTRISQ